MACRSIFWRNLISTPRLPFHVFCDIITLRHCEMTLLVLFRVILCWAIFISLSQTQLFSSKDANEMILMNLPLFYHLKKLIQINYTIEVDTKCCLAQLTVLLILKDGFQYNWIWWLFRTSEYIISDSNYD